MEKHDSLGDRMKKYEDVFRHFLPTRTYTIIRLDGKSFHTFTRGCKKPFDRDLMDCMQFTALKLCEEVQNVKLGYTQSDEITLVLTDFDQLNSAQWFDGNLNKIISVAAGIATAEFNKQWMLKALEHMPANTRAETIIDSLKSAVFDARPIVVSDPWEAFNQVLWRQNDASKNSLQMLARSLYPHKELQSVNAKGLHDMIHAAGENWNDQPTDCKRGAFIVKTDIGWEIDREGPILSQDKNYFFSRVPQIPGYVPKVYRVEFWHEGPGGFSSYHFVEAYHEDHAKDLAEAQEQIMYGEVAGSFVKVWQLSTGTPGTIFHYDTDRS